MCDRQKVLIRTATDTAVYTGQRRCNAEGGWVMVFANGNLLQKQEAEFQSAFLNSLMVQEDFTEFAENAADTIEKGNNAEQKLIRFFKKYKKTSNIKSFKSEVDLLVAYYKCAGMIITDNETDKSFNNILTFHRELFLSTEKYCINSELFWRLAACLWIYIGNSDKRWEEAFNRYDRMKVAIFKRVQFFGGWLDLDNGQYVRDWLGHQAGNQTIKVYRGFHARKGKRIRKGETKVEDNWYIQEEGAGYSYTLSKYVASMWGSAQFNKEILRRHSSLTEEQIEQFRHANLVAGLKDIHNGEDAFFVGEYEINKKDIVGLFFSRRREYEVVATKSKLIRYEVQTAQKTLTAFIIKMLMTMTSLADELEGTGRTFLMEGIKEQKLMNGIEKIVKEIMEKNKGQFHSLIDIRNIDEIFSMVNDKMLGRLDVEVSKKFFRFIFK